MCYFISVAVDKKYESTLKQKLRSSFTLLPSENSSIANHLKPQDTVFLITNGMCACELFAKPDFIEKSEETLRQKYSKPKYKKLGWTEAKIERAIANRLSKPAKDFSGLREDLRWSLYDLVSETKRATVIVHFYSDDIETEEVSITEKRIITCEDLQNKDASIEEDTLIEVVL
jgi:hypothetical protein